MIVVTTFQLLLRTKTWLSSLSIQYKNICNINVIVSGCNEIKTNIQTCQKHQVYAALQTPIVMSVDTSSEQCVKSVSFLCSVCSTSLKYKNASQPPPQP